MLTRVKKNCPQGYWGQYLVKNYLELAMLAESKLVTNSVGTVSGITTVSTASNRSATRCMIWEIGTSNA
jgi:hypothetical protein